MARRESSALKPQGQSLSVEDTDFLKKNTKYSEEDIKLWFKNFKKDCPNGILDKKKVCEIYEQKISPNRDSKFIVDQLFRIIDDDNNGGIDFKEFMLAVNMAVSGTPEEKLRWMFRFYDEDNSGSIEMDEMSKVLGNIYLSEGLSQKDASKKAKELFNQLDIDCSGEIDKEEFIQGCLQDLRQRDTQLPRVTVDHFE